MCYTIFMYTYRTIFKQALSLTFKHPSLWLFAGFAAFLGTASEIDLLFGGYAFGADAILFSFVLGLVEGGALSIGGLQGIGIVLATQPVFLLAILLVMLIGIALSSFGVLVMVVSQTALVSQTVAMSSNRTLRITECLRLGVAKFWPVFGFTVMLRIGITALIFLTTALATVKMSGILALFIVVFDILLVIAIIFSFLIKYAILGVILKGWKFSEAPKQALEIFRRNWLLSIEIAVVLFMIVLVTVSFLLFMLPVIFYYTAQLLGGFSFGVTLILLLSLVALAATEIALTIFHWATWAVVFELLTSKKATLTSFLQRILGRAS